jgi:hypothetical protein
VDIGQRNFRLFVVWYLNSCYTSHINPLKIRNSKLETRNAGFLFWILYFVFRVSLFIPGAAYVWNSWCR